MMSKEMDMIREVLAKRVDEEKTPSGKDIKNAKTGEWKFSMRGDKKTLGMIAKDLEKVFDKYKDITSDGYIERTK